MSRHSWVGVFATAVALVAASATATQATHSSRIPYIGVARQLPGGSHRIAYLSASTLTSAASKHVMAMISIRAHVTLDDDTLHSLRVMELTEAADVLADWHGARAESFRRRAIAALAAREITWAAARPSAARRPDIQAALARLGIGRKELSYMRTQLLISYPYISFEDVKFPWLQAILINALAKFFPHIFKFPPCWYDEPPGASVTPGQAESPVELHTNVSVDVRLAEVKMNIDPQRWDDCSEFWDPPPDAVGLADWNFTTHLPVPTTSGHDPGGHHPSPSLLHERFRCGLLCGNTDFDLALCVKTYCQPAPGTGMVSCPSATEFTVTYDLPKGNEGRCECPQQQSGTCPVPCQEKSWRWWMISGRVGGNDAEPCADDGNVHAWIDPNDPDRSIVSAVKQLHFHPRHLSTTLRIAWQLYLGEMNDELGELACCLK